MKGIDFTDPKAVGALRKRLADCRAELAELDRELELLRAAPLTNADRQELLRRQIARAGAWWLNTNARAQLQQLNLRDFEAEAELTSFPHLSMVSAEPRVIGLPAGMSSLCCLLPDQLLAGYRRAIEACALPDAGLDQAARRQSIAEVQVRIDELRVETSRLSELADLAGQVAEHLRESSPSFLQRVKAIVGS